MRLLASDALGVHVLAPDQALRPGSERLSDFALRLRPKPALETE